MRFTALRSAGATAALLLSVAAVPLSAQSGSLTISGQANLWYAGLGAPAGDGLLPPSFALNAGTGRTLTFSGVTGLINCCSSTPGTAPDGDAIYQYMNSLGGI